jgi:hypothetical protein
MPIGVAGSAIPIGGAGSAALSLGVMNSASGMMVAPAVVAEHADRRSRSST